MTNVATPAEALSLLHEGNARFVNGLVSIKSLTTAERRKQLANDGQKPFAIVLCCADSRAPAELIFDVGLGDLFVVRVAGNIITPGLLGSIEFAALNFKSPLCIVLGHTGCGAVKATAELIETRQRAPSDHIQDIVLEIEPSVLKAKAAQGSNLKNSIQEDATRINIQRSAQKLIERSQVIAELVEKGKLKIAAGIYDLHSGRVEFFEP